MATSQLSRTLQHLRSVMLRHDSAELKDGALLDLFVNDKDDAAFEALVHRHGPMVLGVCQRVLHNRHDAEDAFQATFLILVRKATSIHPRHMVGSWLYGVAYRTALEARRAGARRRAKERQAMARPRLQAADDPWQDLQPVLDQEMARLPEHYRAVLVLCDVEGKTRKEVALQFGWAEGTVASRLARGRVLLAKRLASRGIALSAGVLALLLSEHASAGMPALLVSGTVKAAHLMAAGKAATTSIVSAKVAGLMKGVLQGMLLSKLKTTSLLALGLLVAVAGLSLLTRQALAANQDEAGDQGRPKPAQKQVPQQTATITIKDIEMDELDAQHRTFTGTIGRRSQALQKEDYPGALLDRALRENIATPEKKDTERKDAKKVDKPAEAAKIDVIIVQELNKTIEAQMKTMAVQMAREFLENKPSRLLNVPIAPDAKITIGRKEVTLADLKPGMHVSLRLAARETGMVIVGVSIGE